MDFLGKVASTLGPAMELKNCIYEPVKRELDYLLCFDDNVKNARDEARKLEDKRAGLQMIVDKAENNASVVLPVVKSWFREVTDIQAKMDKIETEIATTQNGGFSQSLHRRSLSKKVKMVAEAMKELQNSCGFEIISVPPLPAASAPIQLGSAYEFKSRKHIEEGVMTSLRDDKVYKVGICGMGGVGKTTLAKRIMRRAREEDLFEEIVMVVVSQNADKVGIQDDIAGQLGLGLGEGSLYVKAHKLRTRLSESTKRSLIVVDDIWGYLNLDDLGIPSCHSRCKVLITSRNRDVFNDLNVDKIHAVEVLSKDEAWHLFKLNVGSCIDHPKTVSVARQVLEECKGLPIALVTVGATLKNKEDTRVWNDLLHQLKGCNPITLPKVLDDVYKPLRLSYKCLENKQAKSLFLLCCLYREDGDIPLDELTFYALGLGILKGIDRLEQARNRVCSLVEMLKSRFLLLEGYHENHVRMHDVVRDVAVFIATDKKWIISDAKSNDCSWISPYIEGRPGLHADSRVFSNLHLLWINCCVDEDSNINDCFFEGMKNLNVLSINNCQLTWLPETTLLLKNLQTLVLECCESLESISVIGELINLKILICRSCYSIESLPMEIGRLSGLKLLELSNCENLKTIPPGIISKLKELEELIVEEWFDGWEAKNMGKESKNASLSELDHLSSLSRLRIEISDSGLAAEQIRLSSNLKEYHIIIGYSREYRYERNWYKRKMELFLPGNISPGEWIRELVGSVEYMRIEGDGSSLDFAVADNMRVLKFSKCSTVKTLVSTKTTDTVFPLLEELYLSQLSELKEICDINGPMSSNSFNNLQQLRLSDLPALEHLNIVSTFNKLSSVYVSGCAKLSSMMIRGSSLVQLESLEVWCCEMMEQVLLWDEEEDQIVFQNLKKIELSELPNLTSFSKGIKSIGFPALEEMNVQSCAQLKSLFPFSSLVQLESLEIKNCGMMEQVLLWDEEEDQIVFQNLKKIELSELPNLISFSKGIKSIGFPVLEEMHVQSCARLKNFVWTTSSDDDWVLFKSQKFEFGSLRTLEVGGYIGSICRNWCPMMVGIFTRLSMLKVTRIWGMKSLFPYSVAQDLHNLRVLRIGYCDDMVGVIEEDACGGETPPTPTPLLPNLERIYLWGLPKLKSFCECKHALEFPSLTILTIMDCDLMEEFTWGHVSTPILPCIFVGMGASISINDVNAFLKHRRLKIQEEHNSRLKNPIAEMMLIMEERLLLTNRDQTEEEEESSDKRVAQKRVEEWSKRNDAWLSIGPPNEFQLENLRIIQPEEEHNSRLEGSSVEQKVEDVPIEMMMMVQNVEERHPESMVEESRKRHTGITIGLENEFQPEKRRRIGTEVEHSGRLERSSLPEQMKTLFEIMVENEEEVIKHLDSMIENWRKRHAELSIRINNESQSEKRRRIETEEEHSRRLEGSSVQQNMKAPTEIVVQNVDERRPEKGKGIVTEVEMAHHNIHFTQGESSAAPEIRRQLLNIE